MKVWKQKRKKKEEVQLKVAATEEAKIQEATAPEETPPVPPEESTKEATPDEVKTEEPPIPTEEKTPSIDPAGQ